MEVALAERSHIYAKSYKHIYPLPGGVQASSRVDRWYISFKTRYWIRDISMKTPGHRSNHIVVTIRIAARQIVVHKRKAWVRQKMTQSYRHSL
uniref:Uncharacterized protein n=1 Tax=Hyaloperonospora arabidopsidis (strain Emoy2) TaxID=559515 RepID=M4B897_HYAAE